MKRFLLLPLFLFASTVQGSLEEYPVKAVNDGTETNLKALAGNKKFLVLIAHGTECSVFRSYTRFINEIIGNLRDMPVQVVVLNSFLNAKPESIQKELQTLNLKAPIYLDVDQKAAKHFGMTTLSETALIDVAQDKLLYRGAIDDRVTYYYTKTEARKKFLLDAIASALKGEPIQIERTKPFGCAIQFKRHKTAP